MYYVCVLRVYYNKIFNPAKHNFPERNMEPSTSSAAKRPRVAEEDNGKPPVCTYLNCSVEKLIVDVLSYFSYECNWNIEMIERLLIPKILSYSDTFQGGRVADFSKIKNIDIEQAKILMKIFRNCSELIINHMVTPSLQLCYISNFRDLQKLTITISEADNFSRTSDRLTIKKLKIKADGNYFKYDPISQILNISPQLEKISFHGGTITMDSMTFFAKSKLQSIKLKNVILDPFTKKPMLTHIDTNLNLKSLKFILTQSFFKNESFYALSYDFLRVYSNLHSNLQKLTFTLCQYSEQKLSNLINLPNLKTLKIFYSAQFNTKNFQNLINILIQLKEDIEISLIEYYIPPPESNGHPQYYLNGLTVQSARIKMLFQESTIGHRLKIITCQDYE